MTITNITDVGEEQMAGVVADALRAFDAGASGAAVVSEGRGVTVTFPDGTQYEVNVQKLHDGISDVVGEGDTSEPDIVDAATLLAALREVAPGLLAEIDQTGGGCATIFVGERLPLRQSTEVGEQEEAFLLCIGPGSYNWNAPGDSRFHWDELYVGPDDWGETEPARVRSLAGFKAHCRSLLAEPDWRQAKQPNGGTAR